MEKTQHSASAIPEEAGLLDVLVHLATNIKLLVLGPLAVGLCALAISFFLTPTYPSVAVLTGDQTTASLIGTAAVLDPVIATLGLARDETVEAARTQLREQIKAVVGRNDKLLTLTVSSATALQAQTLANALLLQTYQESRPKGNVRTRLETQLDEAKKRLENAQDASVSVLKRIESTGLGGSGGPELARGYADLLTATGAAQSQISALEAQLEGISAAQLVQAPTLPQKSDHPKKALIAIGASLAAGLALLIFVFMRQAFRNLAADETSSEKLARIQQLLRLK